MTAGVYINERGTAEKKKHVMYVNGCRTAEQLFGRESERMRNND